MGGDWRGIAGLTLGTVAIGFAGIWVRLSSIGPIATGFWRLALAFLIVALWGVLFDLRSVKKILDKENRRWLKLTAIAGFAFGADLAIWHLSIHNTTVAMATLFANFAPFFMLLGAILFLGEKLHPKALMGIGLCAAGIVFLSMKNSILGTRATWQGNSMALGAAFFYAIYLLVLRKAGRSKVKPIYALAIASLTGAILLLPMTLYWEPDGLNLIAVGDMKLWVVLLLLAGTSQVLGQGLITACLSKVSGELSSAILCLQSVFAALAGYFIISENISLFQIAGGAIVISGIFLVRWAAKGT